jgi:hypothetical protein
MKIFILFSFLFLEPTVGDSSKFLDELVSYFDNFQANYGTMTDPQNVIIRTDFGALFLSAQRDFMAVTAPCKVIRLYSALSEHNMSFVLYFWANFMTMTFESKVWSSEGGTDEQPKMWEKALISLISFINEHLLILEGKERDSFVELALEFYKFKLRRRARKYLKEKTFDKIDREFHRFQKNAAASFYDFEVPNEVHFSLLQAYLNINSSPNQPEHKAKFFFLVRYSIKKDDPFELLTWLTEMPTRFVKTFLVFCNFLAINIWKKKKIRKFKLTQFKIGLGMIIPMFKKFPKSCEASAEITEMALGNNLSINGKNLNDFIFLWDQLYQKLF